MKGRCGDEEGKNTCDKLAAVRVVAFLRRVFACWESGSPVEERVLFLACDKFLP